MLGTSKICTIYEMNLEQILFTDLIFSRIRFLKVFIFPNIYMHIYTPENILYKVYFI